MGEHRRLRASVRAFAEEMDRVLDRNSHKGGWKEEDVNYLLGRLFDELGEAVDDIVGCDSVSLWLVEQLAQRARITLQTHRAALRRELVDVANFCMMLHQRLGAEAR